MNERERTVQRTKEEKKRKKEPKVPAVNPGNATCDEGNVAHVKGEATHNCCNEEAMLDKGVTRGMTKAM